MPLRQFCEKLKKGIDNPIYQWYYKQVASEEADKKQEKTLERNKKDVDKTFWDVVF